MERGNNELGNDSNGIADPTTVVIAQQLFDNFSYNKIIDFMDHMVPLMPVSVDNDDFIRHNLHNVEFFKLIHKQLVPLANEIFGEPLKPSYVFLSMYKDNGICPLHIDRPQCYRTIDYLIRTTSTEPWPIHIGEYFSDIERASILEQGIGRPETPEAIEKRIAAETWTNIELNPNDAVCYSGTNQWHYRSQRLKGTADLVFFHFVQEAFDGPLD